MQEKRLRSPVEWKLVAQNTGEEYTDPQHKIHKAKPFILSNQKFHIRYNQKVSEERDKKDTRLPKVVDPPRF